MLSILVHEVTIKLFNLDLVFGPPAVNVPKWAKDLRSRAKNSSATSLPIEKIITMKNCAGIGINGFISRKINKLAQPIQHNLGRNWVDWPCYLVSNS